MNNWLTLLNWSTRADHDRPELGVGTGLPFNSAPANIAIVKLWRSQRRGEEPPRARDSLELLLAAILELDA